MTQQEEIASLKVKFLEYYRELPIQKLAATFIGRTEDTISIWKRDDQQFSDDIEAAKSEFALKNVKAVRNREWVLERILKEYFPKDPDTINNLTQNNFMNLDDEQLEKLIRAKLKQTGTDDSTSGEGEKNAPEPA